MSATELVMVSPEVDVESTNHSFVHLGGTSGKLTPFCMPIVNATHTASVMGLIAAGTNPITKVNVGVGLCILTNPDNFMDRLRLVHNYFLH